MTRGPHEAASRQARDASSAFTLIELLVVIAVIALLIGMIIPALAQARANARATACGARLQQLGIALQLYFNDYSEMLPQANGSLPGGGQSIIGSLFGGKKGRIPFYDIDRIGAEKRPLNRYLINYPVPPDSEPGIAETIEYRSPVDKGASSTGLPIPGLDRTLSMYDFVGSSYTLNDHTLDGEDVPTLVPIVDSRVGGRMPYVKNTAKTWVIGTHTVYNYQENGDRGMRWFDKNQVQANLLFVDLHAKMRVRVPAGIVNTTDDYTFLP